MNTCSNKYEYYIYGGLGLLLVISEALGLTKSVQPNSLLQLAGIASNWITKNLQTQTQSTTLNNPILNNQKPDETLKSPPAVV